MSQQPTQGDGDGIIPRLVRIEEKVAALPVLVASLGETATQVQDLVTTLRERCPARLETCAKEREGLRVWVSEVNKRTWALGAIVLSVVTALAWVLVKVAL